MARGVALDEQTRAAVMASLLAGQSINAVAKQHGIGKATASALRKEADARLAGSFRTANTTDDDGGSTQFEHKTNSADDIPGLILDYLRANLRALKVQAELFGDRAWLEKQPASELAVTHGIMFDKSIRVLESVERSTETEET